MPQRQIDKIVELRDRDEARSYLLQGIWLQRVVQPSAPSLKSIWEWAIEILSNGYPIPPIGFLSDVGHLALGHDSRLKPGKAPGHWPSNLIRGYEDQVLGKFYADWSFERASDAIRRYQGRDRARALGYLIKQFRDRTQTLGVDIPPGIVRSLLVSNPVPLLQEGFDQIEQSGPHPLLVQQYEGLISACRRLAEVLGPEDVLALEQRTAIAEMGQYVAHRQILQHSKWLESKLPRRPVAPLPGRREVPTRVMDEDQYPVGGYSSISNRGSIESLLHSQLAYMEDANSPDPDLFDVKFIRDELFYYSRDENKFLRRRRAFVFLFAPDLLATRYKDPELPTQRIVLLLSLVLVTIRQLSDWMSTDALQFDLLFVRKGSQKPLTDEMVLMEILLKELRERGIATVREIATEKEMVEHCLRLERTSQLQVLTLRTSFVPLEIEGAVVTNLLVAGAKPELRSEDGKPWELDGEDLPLSVWSQALYKLLQLWIG